MPQARAMDPEQGHATDGGRAARTQKFAPAFECPLASGKPAILNCLLDPRTQSHAKDYAPHQVAAL
jgi:acetolactate synthase-1/2/3 large subunit